MDSNRLPASEVESIKLIPRFLRSTTGDFGYSKGSHHKKSSQASAARRHDVGRFSSFTTDEIYDDTWKCESLCFVCGHREARHQWNLKSPHLTALSRDRMRDRLHIDSIRNDSDVVRRKVRQRFTLNVWYFDDAGF